MDLFNAFVPLSNPRKGNSPFYSNFLRNLIRKKSKLFKVRRQSDLHMRRYKDTARRCRKEIRDFHLAREEKNLRQRYQLSVQVRKK